MIQCPIDYFADNLIFNSDKSCWAVYALSGFDYDFLSMDGKIQILYKTTRFLSGIMSEAQMLIIPVEQNIKENFKSLKRDIKKNDPLCKQAYNHIDLTEDYLMKKMQVNGLNNDYNTYIVVKLEERGTDEIVSKFKDAYEYFIKSPTNAINVFMNLDTKDILLSKMNSCIKLANKWFYEQETRIKMEKVDVEGVQWLLRRVMFRGLNKNVKMYYNSQDKRKKWEPKNNVVKMKNDEIIKPIKRDIVNLFSGIVKTNNRVLTVEHDKETSYQSFLVLPNIPDEFDYPGLEWVYMMQKYNYQAEFCIHIKATDYREGLHKLDFKKREIDSQITHITEANSEIPEDIFESKEYADAMESELKGSRYPILNTTVGICVAADNLEELEKRVSDVKNEYEDLNFIVERPLTDQLNLFMQFIPSVGITVKDFNMPLTPMTLASGVIGATHKLGDDLGPYIGTTGVEEKHVFLNMGLACLKNKSASATFFGNLGYGKSFNANLLVFQNVLYGGYGLIFDPKGERSHWVTDLKILKGLITVVSLSSKPEFRGKLDPYNIYKEDINLANELALNVISELFKINPTSDEYTALLETARIMKEEKKPSMLKFAEILEHFKEDDELYKIAKNLARRIRLQQGMSQLLFGDGTEDAISIENRLNIVLIENLKLPSPESKKEDYTSEENLSCVLMMVLSHFAKKFALVKRPVFKTILFDESWMLGKTAEGAKLYDYLARMGRSLYTGCIFNGHSVLDIQSEGVKNAITYKFCFNTGNDDEAIRMIDYLGLENTEKNREKIKSLENGSCLFQDLNGHVGELKFDAVFQDIIDVFSTTPTTDIADSSSGSTDSTSNESKESEEERESANKKEEYYFDDVAEKGINIYEREAI